MVNKKVYSFVNKKGKISKLKGLRSRKKRILKKLIERTVKITISRYESFGMTHYIELKPEEINCVILKITPHYVGIKEIPEKAYGGIYKRIIHILKIELLEPNK